MMQQQFTTAVIRVGLHCDGCARRVKKALPKLKKIAGVDVIEVELKAQQVTVKGVKLDPAKVLEELQKMGKSPHILKIIPQEPKEEEIKHEIKQTPAPQVQIKTVELKVALHCEGCAKKIKRKLERTPGIHDVKIDFGQNKVTVKGMTDQKQVLEAALKTGKAAQLWPKPKVEESKKKEEESIKKEAKDEDEGNWKEMQQEDDFWSYRIIDSNGMDVLFPHTF